MTMSENFGDRKLNMATSGTILSLSARRPSRKPSDGGGGTSEQRVRRESDAAPRPIARRAPGHVTARHSPPASANPSSTARPALPLSHSPHGPISLAARDRIPEYRCCPAYGTSAKGVTRLTARPENIRDVNAGAWLGVSPELAITVRARWPRRMIMKDCTTCSLLKSFFDTCDLRLITLRDYVVYLVIKWTLVSEKINKCIFLKINSFFRLDKATRSCAHEKYIIKEY